MAQVEIFTPSGVVSGIAGRMPLVGDGPTLEQPLPIDEARWYPHDGAPPARRGSLSLLPDDILVVVTPEPDVKVHANWYAVVVELGPYRVSGQLSTPPGFDPERAITRPGGSFVPLRDAVIELRSRPDAGAAERAYVQVNRFAVERVTSTLMLGFFFPGATFVAPETVAAT